MRWAKLYTVLRWTKLYTEMGKHAKDIHKMSKDTYIDGQIYIYRDTQINMHYTEACIDTSIQRQAKIQTDTSIDTYKDGQRYIQKRRAKIHTEK